MDVTRPRSVYASLESSVCRSSSTRREFGRLSVQFPPRPTYWVTGNCNNWNFSKLLHDEKVPGVFRHRFVMKAGQSGEFKVVKNADADFELYEGELDEVLGEVFEITLDLNHDDRIGLCLTFLERTS